MPIKAHNERKRAPGGGRKSKPPDQIRITVSISMAPYWHKVTEGNRSKIIEKALDYYYEHKGPDD